MQRGDRVIRWTTTLSVIVLAGIAAVLSYKHMYVLVRRYGEMSWTSALLPVSAVGRLIAAWPSCALIGSYELLMRQVRNAATGRTPLALQEIPQMNGAADEAGSYAPHTDPANDALGSYDLHTAAADPPIFSYDAQTDSSEALRRTTDEAGPRDPAWAGRSRPRRAASESQHDGWQWAIANRTPAGDLPSGKAIAERFGRRERWGRLVKQAGTTGRLDLAFTP